MLMGKCRVSLSRKGPKSTSQRLSMLRSATLGQMKALLLVIQKTPGNKTEIDLVQSYALITFSHVQKFTSFRPILPEIEPVTS